MVYLLTFTINIPQMRLDIPYMDSVGKLIHKHTILWDSPKSTQTTPSRHIDQVCLNRDFATTPTKKLDLASSNSTFTKATGRSSTSSVQQQASCSVQRAQYIHLRCRIWAMGSTIVDQPPCCNYIPEYISMISHRVFQHDFRHVLSQHEILTHGEVHVQVLHNMSVIHNEFYFCDV